MSGSQRSSIPQAHSAFAVAFPSGFSSESDSDNQEEAKTVRAEVPVATNNNDEFAALSEASFFEHPFGAEPSKSSESSVSVMEDVEINDGDFAEDSPAQSEKETEVKSAPAELKTTATTKTIRREVIAQGEAEVEAALQELAKKPEELKLKYFLSGNFKWSKATILCALLVFDNLVDRRRVFRAFVRSSIENKVAISLNALHAFPPAQRLEILEDELSFYKNQPVAIVRELLALFNSGDRLSVLNFFHVLSDDKFCRIFAYNLLTPEQIYQYAVKNISIFRAGYFALVLKEIPEDKKVDFLRIGGERVRNFSGFLSWVREDVAPKLKPEHRQQLAEYLSSVGLGLETEIEEFKNKISQAAKDMYQDFSSRFFSSQKNVVNPVATLTVSVSRAEQERKIEEIRRRRENRNQLTYAKNNQEDMVENHLASRISANMSSAGVDPLGLFPVKSREVEKQGDTKADENVNESQRQEQVTALVSQVDLAKLPKPEADPNEVVASEKPQTDADRILHDLQALPMQKRFDYFQVHARNLSYINSVFAINLLPKDKIDLALEIYFKVDGGSLGRPLELIMRMLFPSQRLAVFQKNILFSNYPAAEFNVLNRSDRLSACEAYQDEMTEAKFLGLLDLLSPKQVYQYVVTHAAMLKSPDAVFEVLRSIPPQNVLTILTMKSKVIQDSEDFDAEMVKLLERLESDEKTKLEQYIAQLKSESEPESVVTTQVKRIVGEVEDAFSRFKRNLFSEKPAQPAVSSHSEAAPILPAGRR